MKLQFCLVLLLVAALFSSGCAITPADSAVRRLNHQARASGSPYRYRAHNALNGSVVEKYRAIAPVPGPIPADLRPTVADLKLQTDILTTIAVVQQGWGCQVAPSLIGVKATGVSNGAFQELWFVTQDSGALRYRVTMTPRPKGGTGLKITGPLD